MTEAMVEAQKSSLSEWRMGAVIVKGNRIIGRGFNRFSADVEKFRLQFGFSETELWSLHAEMDAIASTEEDLEGAVMFVAGFKGKNGNPIVCRPCKKCQAILRHVPIEAVYYQNRKDVGVIYVGNE